jgi:hypothetical protein
VVIRLDGDDLELAVTTAYLGGRVAEAMAALQRLAGPGPAAARA